jgi:catechol 2,3-dioxygenase-like lactoylglutathione lyase family enzyme
LTGEKIGNLYNILLTMHMTPTSIRPFIGAKNFTLSRRFYVDLGFEEISLSSNLSLFQWGSIGFYLQDVYVADWINNTMVFVEVVDVDAFWKKLTALQLPQTYENVKVLPIRNQDWGKECFVHDPSGVLWHFGQFH